MRHADEPKPSAAGAVHEELRRHDIDPFGHVLADALHRAAAAFVRAGGVVGLVPVFPALQAGGQRLAPRATRDAGPLDLPAAAAA